jgi:hypothetical protein
MLLFVSLCLISSARVEIKHKDTKRSMYFLNLTNDDLLFSDGGGEGNCFALCLIFEIVVNSNLNS